MILCLYRLKKIQITLDGYIKKTYNIYKHIFLFRKIVPQQIVRWRWKEWSRQLKHIWQ